MKYTRILGTGSHVPEKTLTNSDLEKIVDTSDEWIFERTGIRERPIASPAENSLTMAEVASNRAIDAANIDRNKIGLIVVGTTTPPSIFPNTANLLQSRLGISNTECPTFDVSAACSGFIYAFSIADKYIRSGEIEYALVVGVDSLSKFVDWSDRSTCVLFSDAAGAVVVGSSDEPGVFSTHLHSNGSYGDLLYVAGDLYSNSSAHHIKMRGNELFKIAVKKLEAVVDEALKHNNLSKEDIDWLVPHQANARIINATAKKLHLPEERVVLTIEKQGNNSAASVPLALDLAICDGRIKRGNLLLLEAFGAGLTWGAALVRY